MKGQRMAALSDGDTAADGDLGTLWPGATEVVCARCGNVASTPDRRRKRVGARGKNTRWPQSAPPTDILDDGRPGYWRLRRREIA